MKKISVSLILPCYNEAEHILLSTERIFSVLRKTDFLSEVIFVDDRSTDDTRLYLEKIRTKYPRLPISIIFHKKNKGRGASVSDGIKKARGEIVGFIDIDCEIAPHYIQNFVNTVKTGADVVIARRIYEFKLATVHRYIASKIYAYIAKAIFNLKVHDTEAGYKFFKRKAIIPVINQVTDTFWFWDTEIIVRSKINGLTVAELPARFTRRNDKTSTVKIIPDTLRYIKKIIMLRLELNSKI